MRLLDTATITLHEFHGDSIPPYAILSHTWGKEEVSFQLFPKAEAKSLAGYAKIVSFCKLAAARGMKYGWVDTCCIDKTSSAELSEAINSMWRWYEKSGVCIAFLVDCSKTSYHTFYKSRWFTRGWTLQELLAPAHVVFYDCRWNKVGDKVSLALRICSVTGISLPHLRKPGMASIAAKMSWMSRRQTTRLEDIAYSLLGLFSVYMPLIYGEGTNAFVRLQQEIVKSSNDETIFAWTDESLTEAGMLALSPGAFRNSSDVVTFQHSGIRRRPYSITNFGLEIEAINSGMRTDVTTSASGSCLYRLPIACRREDDPDPLAVSLLSTARKTVRVDLEHLKAFEGSIDPQTGYQLIYVRSSYRCKSEQWRESPLELCWNEAFGKFVIYSSIFSENSITKEVHQYGVIFTDYKSDNVIADFSVSELMNDSERKEGYRFRLWWRLGPPGTHPIGSTIRVTSPSHTETYYGLRIERGFTFRLWDDLEVQVRMTRQKFRRGSSLISFELVD